MRKKLRGALGTTAVFGAAWTIGLTGCDATPPATAPVAPTIPTPVESIEPEDEAASDEHLAAVTEVLRDSDAFSRVRRLAVLLPTLGPEAAPAAARLLATPNFSLHWGAAEIELIVRFWATHEPEKASRWAVLESPMAYRYAAVFASLPLWAEVDPQAAVAATREWSQLSNVRDIVQVALIVGWFAAGDPPELREFIRDIGQGWARQRALSTYSRQLIRAKGIDAATRWAESIPEEEEAYRLAVFRQVGYAAVLFDLDATMRWCADVCAGEWAKDLPGTISRRWVLTDGAAALEWLSEAATPDTHEKSLAVRITFETWLQVAPDAALAWMREKTAGEPDAWLEPIYPVYAEALALDSPAEAIVWAERTKKKWNREFALIKVARAWLKSDEAAAEAWLEQSSLSEESLEKVRAPAPSGPLIGPGGSELL